MSRKISGTAPALKKRQNWLKTTIFVNSYKLLQIKQIKIKLKVMKTEQTVETDKKVGLALSGGAVLGIAHLGVIKVLEENRIPIHCISGTSAGSLVGLFLAAGYNFTKMLEITKELGWGKFGGLTIPKMGLLNSKLLQRFIENRLGKIEFSDLKLPFAATAVDITTGEKVILNSGPVSEAVRASCIIPGIFTPVEKDGRLLVDGGFREFVPVSAVRELGAQYIIAVKLVPPIKKVKPPENIFQIMINTFDLVVRGIAERARDGDVNIIPDLEGLNAYDFNQIEELMKRGEEAARIIVPRIKSDLKPPLLKRIIKKFKKGD